MDLMRGEVPSAVERKQIIAIQEAKLLEVITSGYSREDISKCRSELFEVDRIEDFSHARVARHMFHTEDHLQVLRIEYPAIIECQHGRIFECKHGETAHQDVDQGNFAAAGAPLMTFIAIHDVWVRADLTENNLGNVDVGDKVELTFDVQPGRVYRGRVRNTGLGVQVDTNALGTLPAIENSRSWLRDAQRFPVVIEFDRVEGLENLGLRVGSQVSVVVYTGDGRFMNLLGKMYIRIHAILSYAY